MKKIGIFDSGVETPEEIILAAGFIPYRLFGDPSIEPIKTTWDDGSEEMMVSLALCTSSRSALFEIESV